MKTYILQAPGLGSSNNALGFPNGPLFDSFPLNFGDSPVFVVLTVVVEPLEEDHTDMVSGWLLLLRLPARLLPRLLPHELLRDIFGPLIVEATGGVSERNTSFRGDVGS